MQRVDRFRDPTLARLDAPKAQKHVFLGDGNHDSRARRMKELQDRRRAGLWATCGRKVDGTPRRAHNTAINRGIATAE